MLPGCLILAAISTTSALQDNVLLIVMDDVSNRFVGAYHEGPPEEQPPTPNMDALAALGVRCTNCYANPSCSPTRATLVTGRYGFRTGIGKIVASNADGALSLDEALLPELLAPTGYTSGYVGKWHLGRTILPFVEPILHQWDFFIGTKRNAFDYYTYKQWMAYPWASVAETYTSYSTSRMTDQTIQLVRQLPEPWFVMLSYQAVHWPEHVPPADLYDRPTPQTPFEMYVTMIEAMDTEMGRLFGNIDFGNTTVILVADNGSKADFLHHKGKGTLYEPGINVPLIVAGAAVPPASRGGVAMGLVNTTDVYQTVLDRAGVAGAAEDSVSLTPLLANPDRHHREFVLSERFEPNFGPNFTVLKRAAREARYKLIRDVLTGREEMYDLHTADPDTDGPMLNLGGLTPDQQDAYDRLSVFLDGVPLPGS